MNNFLQAATTHDSRTENRAVSHSTSGSLLLDYFSKCSSYRDRDYTAVSADISAAFGENPLQALKTIFYNRLITRKITGFYTSETVQKGQGSRDEYRKSIKYMALNHPKILEKNLWLMPVVGCWKDLWHADLLDILNRNSVISLIERGLVDPYNKDLLSKYLPKIRSASNTKNERHRKLNQFAREVCKQLGWTESYYRKFKSTGKCHTWQRQQRPGLWDHINFDKICGKALFLMANHKSKDGKTMIERHGLEDKYLKWIGSKPVAKFTGYVYELASAANGANKAAIQTLNKQFDGLIELAKKDSKKILNNVWCALDTSGSMGITVTKSGDKHVRAVDICISLGIFFSTLNEGAFKNNVIMFDDTSRIKQLSGSFCDKLSQIPHNSMGGTNFQSVIDEIVRVRIANPNIPIKDYPDTLLIVSDMQFNCSGPVETNYETMMRKLRAVGLPDIKVIWWNLNNGRSKDFTNKINDTGVSMVSGFDPSIINMLTGKDNVVEDPVTGKVRQLTPYESMEKILNQDILNQLSIS